MVRRTEKGRLTMAQLTRQEITIPHSLYGNRTVAAQVRQGLGVHKTADGKRWMISQAHTGLGINRRPYFSKAAALIALDRLLALPVDWTGPADALEAWLRANMSAFYAAIAEA